MIDTKDIKERIESDFGDKALDVIRIFDDAISKADYLNHNRVLRCILFLADKDVEKLKSYIEKATYDPRDVMLWAEYEYQGQEKTPKRIRDFNKSFDQAEKNVNE